MSIPSTKPGAGPGILLVTGHKENLNLNSQTLERPATKTVIVQGSHTLGKTKKKTSQRHSAGNIDYDNISQEGDEPPTTTFRSRSKTVGDAADPPKRSDHDRNDTGAKSEGEEDSQGGTKSKATLGRTPNHLTLRYFFPLILKIL